MSDNITTLNIHQREARLLERVAELERRDSIQGENYRKLINVTGKRQWLIDFMNILLQRQNRFIAELKVENQELREYAKAENEGLF